MATAFEIKTMVERSPWNGVRSTGANDVRVVDNEDDDIRQPKSSSSSLTSMAETDTETSGSGRRRCATVSVSPGATPGVSFPVAKTVPIDVRRTDCHPLTSSFDDEPSVSNATHEDTQQSAIAVDNQISSPVEPAPPAKLDSEKHETASVTKPSSVSTVKPLSSTSIGFSIARILSDSIGSNRVNSACPPQRLEVRSPPLNPGHVIAPVDGNLYRTAGDWASRRRSSSPDAVRAEAISSAALPVVVPFDLCRSQTVHNELDSNRRHNSPMNPSTTRPAVILSPTLARRNCNADDHPTSRRRPLASNEGCSDNDDEFPEDIDDTDNEDDMDDEQSDDRSMPLDFDVDEDDLKKATAGVAVITADDRNRDVDGLCRRRQISIVDKVQRLVDLPDCAPGLEQLTWLQCTRYKPPKLPRKQFSLVKADYMLIVREITSYHQLANKYRLTTIVDMLSLLLHNAHINHI
jgi:hypothetical protein